MPAPAATPADRGECAASADKPDVGGAACSRIIDDASESVAERVKAFKNRGRGSFNRKDYDRAIADYGEAIRLSPKDTWAFAHRCQAYESKEDHDAAIADCTEAIKIDPKYGWAYNNRGVAYYGLHEYDAALADHAEAIRVNSRDAWAYARRGMAWTEKGEFDQAVADITEAVTIDPKYAFGFGQRGHALFRKRLITKKADGSPRSQTTARQSSSIQICFGCTARVALPTATIANTTSPFGIAARSSSASPKIPPGTIAAASLTKA
jgi:tetratricopeptide (TPR) repeat protein